MARGLEAINGIIRTLAASRADQLGREYRTVPHCHMDGAAVVDLPKGDPRCPFCATHKDDGVKVLRGFNAIAKLD